MARSMDSIVVLEDQYLTSFLSSKIFEDSAFYIWRHSMITTISMRVNRDELRSQGSSLSQVRENKGFADLHNTVWENHL